TMLRTATRHPLLVASVLPQVGVGAVVGWMQHFVKLGGYSLLNTAEEAVDRAPKRTAKEQYYADRWLDALKYGSGDDYGDSK
ncbi:MAG: FAD-binding oxidoreductase, partial [Phormidesmis sp.]